MIDQILRDAVLPLGEARSLPFAAYTDGQLYDLEREKIFSREWVFVCSERELPNPGDYFATGIAGEHVAVIRGKDGSLRAMSNLCRHRGTVLLDDGIGNAGRRIVCPYHAWSYDYDGTLSAVPYNGTVTIDKDEHRLVEFQLDTWNGLVFVCLAGCARPLRDRFSDIDRYLRAFSPESFDATATGKSDVWQANWKLVIENAIESYHLFNVHRETLEKYTPTRQAFYIAGSSEWSLTGGASRKEDGFLTRLFGRSYDPVFDNYVLISVPPSFVGVLGYGSLGWLSVHPIDTTATRIRSGTIGKEGMLGDDRSSAEFTEAFFEEDRRICERVQRSMGSRFGRGGKLVELERVVVDFHQFLSTRLLETPATPHYEDEAARPFLSFG